MYKRITGVYLITNLKHGNRTYVGSSINILQRWFTHKDALKKGKHINPKLQRAWNKYGEEAFHFNIIELVANSALLLQREQHYIDVLEPFYNITRVAGSTLGKKHSETTRAKLSELAKKRTPRSGYTQSPETRAKIAAKAKGRKHAPFSEETRAKLSASLKGRRLSTMTPEGKSRLIEALKNRPKKPMSEEQKAKLSAYWKGRPRQPFSEETRAKLRAAHARRKTQKSEQLGIQTPTLWDDIGA